MSGTQADIGIKPSHRAKRDEFGAPSRAQYNLDHGRLATSPTKGGPVGRGAGNPRGKAAGAPSSKHVSVEYLG